MCHTGFRLSTVTGDQQYIKASSKYFAVALFGGGGRVYVGRHDRPGRFIQGSTPILSGHRGAILDFEWNPFDDSMLATASEDTTIKIWSIPEEWEPLDARGVSTKGKDIEESVVDLVGHAKKVNLLRYHPTASNVIASTSQDYTVKLWDIEAGQELSTFEGAPDLCHDIVWDYKGDNYATTCKDKTARFIDARTAEVAAKIERVHSGVKSTKVVYMGESGKVLTTGFSEMGREVKIWDLKNLEKPLEVSKIDSAAGVLMPLYDADTNVVYLCGKGDGNIRTCEFEDKPPYFHRLGDGFRSTTALKGVCLVPKRGLDVMKCETARLLKVTNESGVQPLKFYVPRKSDAFQSDIFPDTPSGEPAHTAEEWWGGSSKGPELECLNPAKQGGKQNGAGKKKLQTVGTLSASLKKADARIRYLEGKLDAAGISYDKE